MRNVGPGIAIRGSALSAPTSLRGLVRMIDEMGGFRGC